MPLQKLEEYLDSHKVRYVRVRHSPAYTAQEIAASAHIPGKDLAKTVMVRLDGRMHMVVLPAPYRVDFGRLKKATGAKKTELASEEEFKHLCPGCELGAMPPFGNLFDLPVLVAEELAGDEEIAFNAGTHTELVRMGYEDFAKLVKPRVADFARREEV